MKLNAAFLLLLLGMVSILMSSVDAKKCKGKACSRKGEGKAKVGRLKEGKNKNKKRKPAAPFWKKGPPKTRELIVREDTDLTLSCGIKGRPAPAFSWLVNGKAVTKKRSKRKRQRRHRLIIKNVQMEDGGSYTCLANNTLGSLNFTYTVRVLENVPTEDFQVADRPENQTSQVGDTVVFMCRSYDWPTPKVNWARRTVSNKNVMEIMKISDNTTDSTDLVMHGVTKNDSGEYMCFIGNEKTTKQLSAFLSVIDESETLPFEPPCSLHVRRQILSDHTRTCKTAQPVEMHYCMGSCGRSYYIPQLVMSDGSSMFHLNQTCTCCVGVVERLKIVELLCPLGQTKMGFYTLLRECQCQSCSTTDENSTTSPSTVKP